MRLIKLILILLILGSSHLAQSHTIQKELTIGVGNFEPFFIQKDNSGLFVDVIRAVYAQLPQYKINFIYMGNKRVARELSLGRLDAAANINNLQQIKKGHLSLPVFRFSDVAVSLKSNNIALNNVSDLSKYSVGSFQGASDFFGEPYKNTVSKNANYYEQMHMDALLLQLAKNRVNIVIMDKNIVTYHLKHNLRNKINLKDLNFHYLFPIPTSHSFMGFTDPQLRDDFNKALLIIKETGEYEAVYDVYLPKK
jgi:ABC-type amino acid transport substrate-binding protein